MVIQMVPSTNVQVVPSGNVIVPTGNVNVAYQPAGPQTTINQPPQYKA